MTAMLASKSSLIRLGAACALAIAAPTEAVARVLSSAASDLRAPFAFGGGSFTEVALACFLRLPAAGRSVSYAGC